MDAAQWKRLEALFDEARKLPPEEQSAFLDRACEDEALRAELEALLALDDEASGYFDRLAGSVLPSGLRRETSPREDPRSDSDALIGQTVAHYEIEKKLDAGGMGVIYRAHDVKLDRSVALKFLPPHLSADAEAKERFLIEAQAAAALDHKHLCTVYDVGETDQGRLFIAMAYYEGETLKEKIERAGPLPVEEAVDYAAQIAHGLKKAHAAGITHRDIKPANVMITDDGEVKILDFGLAKLAGLHLTKTGATMGTVHYMSPEQAEGEAVDHRTDIWSLGVVLYELLTGVRPFRGEHEQAVIFSILNDQPEPVKARRAEIPEALAAVVMKCLEKDPARRYAEVSELLADLHQSQHPPAVRQRIQQFWNGRGWPVLALGFLLLGVLYGGIQLAKNDEALARQPVVLADFENATEDSLLGPAATEALRIDLSQSSALRVVSPAAVQAALRRMQRSPRTRLDASLAREVAVREQVEAVIEGEVRQLGTTYVITASLVAAETGQLIAGWRETARDADEIIRAIDRLSQKIRENAGESLQSIETSKPLWRVSTSSLAALRKFSMGARAHAQGDFDRAGALYEEATRLDTAFASAHLARALSLSNRGIDRAGQIEAITLAYKHREHLTEAERYGVVGTYHAMVRGNADKAIEAFRNQTETNPHEALWASLGHYLVLTGQAEVAEEALRQALTFKGTGNEYYNLAWAQFAQGKFEAAQATLEELASQYPKSFLPNLLRTQMASASGDYARADSLAKLLPPNRSLYYQALCDAVQGRISEAVRHLQALQAEQANQGLMRNSIETAVAIGRLYLTVRQDTARGVEAVEAALAKHPLDNMKPLNRPYLPLIAFYAKAGRTDQAQALLATYEASIPDEYRGEDPGRFPWVQGLIEIARGNEAQGLAELRAAHRQSFSPLAALADLGRAREQMGQVDAAIDAYEQYLQQRDLYRIRQDAFYRANIFYRLGRFYEQQGDTLKGAASYRHFVALWEASDSTLQTRVVEAEQRAERLLASLNDEPL